jgi:hypothetical protein
VKSVGYGVMAILAAVLAVIVLVSAPESPTGPWWIAVAGVVLALAATAVSLARAIRGGAQAAGVWLHGAGIPVAALWGAASLAQCLTAGWWSWRLALVVQVLAAALWGVVALVGGAAAERANQEESERARARERHARLRQAAEQVIASGERTGVRAEMAARVLASRPGELGDALYEEELESVFRQKTRHGS